MGVFTDREMKREMKLVRKLEGTPPQTILKISEACPLHSCCSPLPLFRLYKIDYSRFEAEWNSYHSIVVKQIFSFADAMDSGGEFR